MTSIALYLIFVGAFSGYRSSKHWPKELRALAWLGNRLWCWTGISLGLSLFILDNGWTTGILLSLCAYMALTSGIIFFANCGSQIRWTACILFHLACIFGFILTF